MLISLFTFLFFASASAGDDEGFLGLILDSHAPSGILVKGLASGASAQKAGIKEGDSVLKFKDTDVHTPKELIDAVRATPPGGKAKLLIRRGDKDMPFEILIVSRKQFLGAGIEELKGKPLPEFSGVDARTQKKMTVSKLLGKPLIVELWATWCPACVASMPKLDAIAKKYKGKINVVGLSFEDLKEVSKFAAHHNVAYALVSADASNLSVSYMSNTSIPKYLIVNAKGIVVGVEQTIEGLLTVVTKADTSM